MDSVRDEKPKAGQVAQKTADNDGTRMGIKSNNRLESVAEPDTWRKCEFVEMHCPTASLPKTGCFRWTCFTAYPSASG